MQMAYGQIPLSWKDEAKKFGKFELITVEFIQNIQIP